MRPPSPPRSDLAPRRLWVALALTLLMPGLGHIYCGLVRRGLVVWASTGLVAVVAVLVWARWLFVPVVPAAVLVAAWGLVQMALAGDLARWCEREASAYRVRPINHGLTYAGLFLGLMVLPSLILQQAVSRWLVASVVVADQGMFPKLLEGDRILVDRRAYDGAAPQPGDMVAVGAVPSGPLVLRVVAVEGQTVYLRDGRPVVDGESMDYDDLVDLHVPRFGAEEAGRLAMLEGYVESSGQRRYVVTYSRVVASREPPPPVHLEAGELYVLGDNRDVAVDSRRFGKITVDEVFGRPAYVWASFDAEGRARPGRVGLDVR